MTHIIKIVKNAQNLEIGNIGPDMVAVIVVCLIIFVLIYKYITKRREPFMDKVNKAVTDVENVGKKVKAIPGEIKKVERKINSEGKKISKTIDSKLKKLLKQVETLVTKKLKNFFMSFINSLKRALVDPLLTLFKAIGNVFVQLFAILVKLGNKIGSLPNCVPYYGIVGVYVAVRNFWKRIIPSSVWKIIEKVGDKLQPVLDLLGYKKIKKRCYDFNVNGEINSIRTGFTKSGKHFKRDFGKFRGIKF
jgi:F0F1-type ATP synthase membrane subunit b/b'